MQSSSMPCGFTSPSFNGCTRGLSEKAIVSLSAMTLLLLLFGKSLPAGVRDIEDHLVGAGPLHLEVAVSSRSHCDVETSLLGETPGLDRLQLLAGLAEVVHLEAEMVDAVVIGPVGADVGILLGFPVQNGQVDVAVGQEHRAARAATDLLESEAFFVKGRDRIGVFRGQCDVLDPRHDVSSCGAQRDWVTVSMSTGVLCSFMTLRPRYSAGRMFSESWIGPSP